MVQIVSKEEFEKIPGEVMWTNVCRVKGGTESGKMDESRKPGAQAFFAAGADKTVQNEAVSLEPVERWRNRSLAGDYRILAFVAMKMEVSWRNAPFRNSGFRKLKPFAGYFTHES